MELSVVIVNYNVKHFLEQCLRSVYAALEGIEGEVWVVDNNSTDGSVQMLRQKFPQVHLIANSDNPGFAKANNQALRQCKGEHLLLLNPDTVVQRDTFRKCLDFYATHPDCGGLSVKMIDGEGHYLRESKRGFPSPKTSFYKVSGLIRIFPHHKKVSAYYATHLDDDQTGEIDILPGAFLMMSRSVIDRAGLLDESYFMYGEDIDFSWRIRLAGMKNYYLPETRILHYKGESTRKSSMNYVYTFYNAMAIFAKKYFSGNTARSYTFLIQIAIWLRASLDFLKRIASHLAVPLLDFGVAFGGFLAIKQVWSTYWAENVNYYPPFYTWVVIPIYILILLFASWLAGGYDKPVRVGRIVQGMSVGALSLLVFYSLLDESLRFSRAIVLLGSVWSMAATIAIRLLLSLLHADGYRLRPESGKRYLVVGNSDEYQRVLALFDTLGIESKCITSAPPDKILASPSGTKDTGVLADARGHVDEIIFCQKDMEISAILDITEQLQGKGIDFRMAPEGMEVLIGSNYTGSPEELYKPDFDNIDSATNRRSKRLLDLVAATLLLLLSPLLFWLQKRKRRYFADCLSVLVGRKTWVGYSRQYEAHSSEVEPLPHLRRGVFHTTDSMPMVKTPNWQLLDYNYAHDYHLITDINILMRNIIKI